MRDRRRIPFALVTLLGLSITACGGPGERPPAEETREDSAVQDTSEAPLAAAPATRSQGPTEEWTGQRAIAAIDAVFPHSPHKNVDCQRCHTRPSSHVTHTGAECTMCHRRPAILATLPERTSTECATCHHERNAARACSSCHGEDAVGARPVLVAIHAAGRADSRVQSVLFSHSIHADRECRSCHTQPVTRRFGGDCSICHEDHHRPEAECTTCHQAAGLAVHASTDVHQGCAGGGCHDDAVVLQLRPTRNICLACHTDQRDHRPGQECVGCHAIAPNRLGGNR